MLAQYWSAQRRIDTAARARNQQRQVDRSSKPGFRPSVESLEDRTVPVTLDKLSVVVSGTAGDSYIYLHTQASAPFTSETPSSSGAVTNPVSGATASYSI